MTSTSIRDHFRDAVEKLIPDFAKSNDKLGLAVSGGPDSLALLLLAHDCYPKQIDAATVDHGLRPEAKEEAEMVADICVKKNIPHNILKPSVPIRGSIQSEARKVRYSLLHGWMERGKYHVARDRASCRRSIGNAGHAAITRQRY